MTSSLEFRLIDLNGRARRSEIMLPHGIVETPTFMAVGTHGTVKGVSPSNVGYIAVANLVKKKTHYSSYINVLQETGYKIILGNTYHLANRPGVDTLAPGLHNFMGWQGNLLTDSGGFQMVSLLRLAEITEEGVSFSSPVDGSRLLLTPEKSIQTQNVIGADIIMALDDVVSAVHPDKTRVEEAMMRTTRWLDRCITAHSKPKEQNLFGIVQGGLHEDLRLTSLTELKMRNLPGYAIGGLSGGEAKADFWRIVELCTRPSIGLPDQKPRYLMGVGYPLDLVVCVALGVDMFDCVFPTRTARFGTALVPEGILRLRAKRFEKDFSPIQKNCPCEACSSYTRAFMHKAVSREPAALRLLTLHNLTYMDSLCKQMREAITSKKFSEFVCTFLEQQFRTGLKHANNSYSTKENIAEPTSLYLESAPSPPLWVKDALNIAGIDISDMYEWTPTDATDCGEIPQNEEPTLRSKRGADLAPFAKEKQPRIE